MGQGHNKVLGNHVGLMNKTMRCHLEEKSKSPLQHFWELRGSVHEILTPCGDADEASLEFILWITEEFGWELSSKLFSTTETKVLPGPQRNKTQGPIKFRNYSLIFTLPFTLGSGWIRPLQLYTVISKHLELTSSCSIFKRHLDSINWFW